MSNFSEVLEEFRQRKGITKQNLATLAELTPSYVSHLTKGTRKNPSRETVAKLALSLKLDKVETAFLFEAADLPIPVTPITASTANPSASPSTIVSKQSGWPINEDWDDVPGIQTLFGREDEMSELIRWVLQDHCQLVIVSGVGGIGKTLLTSSL